MFVRANRVTALVAVHHSTLLSNFIKRKCWLEVRESDEVPPLRFRIVEQDSGGDLLERSAMAPLQDAVVLVFRGCTCTHRGDVRDTRLRDP